MSQDTKRTIDCVSMMWGRLTTPQYNSWIQTLPDGYEDDDIELISGTELGQAMIDALDVYLEFIAEVGDHWDDLFSDLMGWDLVLESFYTECVQDKFNPYENNNQILIADWSYYRKFILDNPNDDTAPDGCVSPTKVAIEDEFKQLQTDSYKIPYVPMVNSTEIVMNTLDRAECEAKDQLRIKIDSLVKEPVMRDDVFEVMRSSLYAEVVRAKIALTGEYNYLYGHGGRSENIRFVSYERAIDIITDDYYFLQRS